MASSTRRFKKSPFVTVYDGFARNFDSKRAGAIIKGVQDGKIPWILLRDYKVPAAEYREAAVMMVRTIRRKNRSAEITVNRRVDLAYELGTGLHLGNHFQEVADARRTLGRSARIGVSLHYGEEVDKRLFQFIDYVFYSPIYRTSSKPGVRPLRKEGLKRFCMNYPKVSVYALGGITPDLVKECFESGASGIAVASGVTRASNILKAAHNYDRAIKSSFRLKPNFSEESSEEEASEESSEKHSEENSA